MSVFIIWWWWSMQHPVFCCFRLMNIINNNDVRWWSLICYPFSLCFVSLLCFSLSLSISLSLFDFSLALSLLLLFDHDLNFCLEQQQWNNSRNKYGETLVFFVFAVFVIKIYKILGYNFLFVFFSFSGRNGFG